MQENSTKATPVERVISALRDLVERDDPDSDALTWGGRLPSANLMKVDVSSRLSGFAPATETTYRLTLHLLTSSVRADDHAMGLKLAGRLFDSLRSRLSRDPTIGGEVVEWDLSGEIGMGETDQGPAGYVDAVLTVVQHAG